MRDVEDLHVMQAIQEGLKGSVDEVMETALSTSEFASAVAMARLDMRSELLLAQYQAVGLLLKEEWSLALPYLQELSAELDSDEPQFELFTQLAT